MISKFTLVICFITLSSAENQDQMTEKYAVSSQSFHREDLPISYEFTAVHIYTTVKPPRTKFDEPEHNTYSIPRAKSDELEHKTYSIQYAPLRHPKEAIHSLNQPEHDVAHQESLEPKFIPERNLETAKKQYIPGHNIELVQAVNRNPGHKTVYRDSNQNFQHKKADYLQRYLLNKDEKQTVQKNTTNARTATIEILPNLYDFLERQKIKSNLLANNKIPENLKNPHPKSHLLHLNVARQYGVAQLIPIKSNNVLEVSNEGHTKLRMYLPVAKNQQSLPNTQLFPIHNRNENFFIASS